MQQAAAFITAIAALIAAVAWPIIIGIIVFWFREPIRSALGRAENVKLGSFFETKLRAEAQPLVDQAVAHPSAISSNQIESASRIQAAARSIDDRTLRNQVESLCLNYENIRASMAAGPSRTHAMTEILVKMRTLGPAIARFLPELMASTAPGERLAAIAVMQIEPRLIDLTWLLQRFTVDTPFLFFHAAVAIQNAMEVLDNDVKSRGKETAREALAIVMSFAGTPDDNTVEILNDILSS